MKSTKEPERFNFSIGEALELDGSEPKNTYASLT